MTRARFALFALFTRLAILSLAATSCAGELTDSPDDEDALAGAAMPTVTDRGMRSCSRTRRGRYSIAKSCTTEPDGNRIGPGYIFQATAFTAGGELVKTRDRRVLDYTPCSSCPCASSPTGTSSESWHGDPRTGGWGKFGIHLTRARYLTDAYAWDDYRTLSTSMCRHVPPGSDPNDPPRAGVSGARISEAPSCDAASGECRLGIAVTLGDEYVNPILEVEYRYRIAAGTVRLWTTVTELETGQSDGWVKEPEFTVSDAGSQRPFARLEYTNADGDICTDGPSPGAGRQAVVAGDNWDPRCATRQCANDGRRRALFDDGTGNCTTGCLQVTARAHTNGVPGGGSQFDWGGQGYGIDEWAARVKEGRRGAPLDSGTWPAYCSAQRRFEAVRWSSNKSPEGSTFDEALFAGWQGGSGASDCRNRYYHFSRGARWSNYFEFVQPGGSRRRAAPWRPGRRSSATRRSPRATAATSSPCRGTATWSSTGRGSRCGRATPGTATAAAR